MEIHIGTREDGEQIRLTEEQLRRHGYIPGLSGTGKSTFMANVFLQLIESREPRYGVLLIDPAGDLVRDVSRRIPKERRDDVIYLDPVELRGDPFALNPFAPLTNDADVDFIAAEIMGVFRLLLEEYWDATLEAALRNVTLTLLSSRNLTLLGERWWPALDEVAPLLMLEVVDDETKPWHKQHRTTYRQAVWYPGLEEGDLTQVYQWFQSLDLLTPNPKARLIASILSKLDGFLSNPVIRNIVCQEGSIDFRRVVNDGKIVLVNLRQEALGDASPFLASLVMAKVLAAVYHQTELDAGERPPFAIFADEFHRYATPSFLELYRQGRKYGAAVFVAHTDRGWLRPWQRSALGNAGSIFCFNLSPEDAWEMSRVFDATPTPAEDEFRPRYVHLSGLHTQLGDEAPSDGEWEIANGAHQALGMLRTLAATPALPWEERTYDEDCGPLQSWEYDSFLLPWLAKLVVWAENASGSPFSQGEIATLRRLWTAVNRWHKNPTDPDSGRYKGHVVPSQEVLESCERLVDYFLRGRMSGTAGYVEERVIAGDGTQRLLDRVPGRSRPYSDVYHQIANDLCHQPDYQARCKVPGPESARPREVVIRTEPLPVEHEGPEADLQFFLERAKSYGQPFETVTEQLRHREAIRKKALATAARPGGDGHSGYDAEPE